MAESWHHTVKSEKVELAFGQDVVDDFLQVLKRGCGSVMRTGETARLSAESDMPSYVTEAILETGTATSIGRPNTCRT